jgi:endonuclease/exonuclease/phosphatase family metal-dependent hydrolase
LIQAQGRELVYLKPDIVTFNEVPQPYVYQMTNYVNAFLPGYHLATNSQGDSYLTSVIASRFPILGSASYLHGTSLTAFGASGYSFTRDLFQATINVPGFPQPLDVFTAHLKATGSSTPQTDATRRAAEAGAISNWFVTVYLPTNHGRPYTLSGDLNEDIIRPDANYTSGHPIQALTSPPTGLQLTTPLNPFANAPTNDLTDDIQSTLDVRFDYILPCPVLFSNIVGSQVFRTDLLTNFPPNLFSNDDKVASDHLPVMMTFANPYDTPFRLLSFGVTNQTVSFKWESQNNRTFNIEISTNLTTWMPFVTNITTTATNITFTTNFTGSPGYFRIYRVP